MSQIAIKFFAVLNPPAEPAEPNSIYLTKPDPESPFDMFVTDSSGSLTPLGNATFVAAVMAATIATLQPLDDNLSAIAALATEAFGRSLLTAEDADAVKTLLEITAGSDPIPLSYLDTDGTMAANSDTKVPSQKAIRTKIAADIAALIAAAPGALNTLDELAAAMGDDANFATTITNALALKAPLASPALTGTPTAPTAAAGTNTTQLATTAHVLAERANTATLTGKRITKRTGTVASSATPTINTDNVDFFSVTALATNITSMTSGLTGTPTDGQTLWIAITGTAARTIAWGSSFEASTVALPTTTVTTNRLDVGFVWNAATSKWRCVAAS